MKYDVITSGYCSMDRIIRINPMAKIGKTSIVQNDDNANIRYGGCGINVATSLSRLNKKTLPIIRVGEDYESNGFKAFLETEKISTEATKKISGVGTSGCYLIENPSSDHMTLFYPGAMSDKYFNHYDSKWFFESKLALMTVASKTDNEYFLKETLNHNLPLFFGSKMDKSAFPPRFIKRIISSCTGVFANEKESEYIRTSMKTENLKELFKTIPKLDFIIITKGKLGSYAMVREGEQIEEYSVPIVPAKKFVDAVGSGDAYIAGFLYGYLEKKTVKECMQYGATLASFVIEGMGATTTAPSISNLENRYQISFLQGDIK